MEQYSNIPSIFILMTFRLITALDWEYAILVTGGLVLSCCAFGCLMRPLESSQAKANHYHHHHHQQQQQKQQYHHYQHHYNNHHQHDRNHRSQKEELSDEEEKPLTLSNGITAGGEPADNGKPQNGHVVLSPPVSDILLCHLFIIFHIF